MSKPSILVKAGRPDENRPLISIDPVFAGWRYTGFEAYKLSPGATVGGDSAEFEVGIVILGGTCDIEAAGRAFPGLGKRKDVWERTPPYAVLVPPGASYTVQAKSELHIAVAKARRPGGKGAPRVITPQEIAAEDRGEGPTYRRIHHILPPAAEALGLILVEVYTPAGNWSSFPPHKHDQEDPPREAYLEEVYYYQINPPGGFALQRVYTDDRGFDEAVAAEDGDAVIVPRGYHPVAAMPGYDCYYLNVMAGPARAWNFSVDPRYAWLMNWKKPAVAGGEGA